MSRNKRHKAGAASTKALAQSVPNLDPLFMASPRLWGQTANLYGESVLIYAAMRAITRRMSSVAVEFVAAGSMDPVRPDAAVLSLFDGPNLIQDGSDLWSCLEGYRLYHGGYIAVLMRNGQPIQPGQIPDTILPFPIAGWKRVTAGNSGNAFATEGWTNDTLRLTVGTRQSVTLIDPDPSGRFALISSVSTVQGAAQTQTEIDAYTASLLANGGRPGFVVTSEAQMSDPNRQRFTAEWQALYGGSYNAGKTAVLTGAKWDLKEISPMKPADVADEQFFRDSVRKVGMAFGVPEFELGITESTNKASSAEVNAKFLTGTIANTFRLHERAWRRQFFANLSLRYSIRFNEFSLPEFADVISVRVENVKRMIEAGTPRNEAYRINGIPVQDQTWGDTAMLPGTLTRAETLAKDPPDPVADPVTAPPSASEPPAQEIPKEEPAKIVPAVKVKALPASLRLKALGDTARRKIAVQAWDKCVTPFESGIAADSEKWVRRWKGYFLKRLNHFLKTGARLDESSEAAKSLSHVIEWKAGKEAPSIPTAQDIAAMMPQEGETVSRLQNAWRDAFAQVEATTVEQMATELGDVASWLSQPPAQHRAIALGRLGDAIKVDETIRTQLTETLTAELKRQPMPTPVQLAETLRTEAAHVFDKATARASTIARTETGAVMGDYRAAIMEAEGVTRKRWSAVHDGHTRPSHYAAEAEGAIAMGQKFRSVDQQRPHDPNGSAANNVNCRCVLLAEVSE